ncbi:hypothetical protein [Paraglaciecola marina]|uniref:hypothetical protein n=1 Tax=Paraglaciecola marina TaxID=2500157 RepID=UPI00105FDDDA|nr:hypothetical protein [Paraglaciecola marina]
MLKETPIKEIIKELGLPTETKFTGYGIHLADSDEFLMKYISNEYANNMWWCKTPEKAELFKNHSKAVKVRNELKPQANVVLIWDVGKQYLVTCQEK